MYKAALTALKLFSGVLKSRLWPLRVANVFDGGLHESWKVSADDFGSVHGQHDASVYVYYKRHRASLTKLKRGYIDTASGFLTHLKGRAE